MSDQQKLVRTHWVKTRLFGHSLTPNDKQLGRIHLDFCETICALDLHPGLRARGGKNRIAVGPNNLWENQGLFILLFRYYRPRNR